MSTHYVFPERVVRVYEKEVVVEVKLIDKGLPTQREETVRQKVGWIIQVGDSGYLIGAEPPDEYFKAGAEVELVLRPRTKR